MVIFPSGMSGAYAQILLRWFYRTWFVLILQVLFFEGYAEEAAQLAWPCRRAQRKYNEAETGGLGNNAGINGEGVSYA
jgi:hypothetical protein